MMPELSIVIVSYNVKDFLYSCIVSIRKSKLTVEIIVVDNNSSDGSIEMVKEKFPFVKRIINTENLGFSYANNQGIALATSDNILLLNPDTELKDGSLEKMISYLQAQKELCIIGPKLINSDVSLQLSCLKFPNVFNIIAEVFYLHFLFSSKEYFQNKM